MNKKISTPYYIDYVYPTDAYGKQSFYYQLVRTKDEAILYANPDLNNVKIKCWELGISCKDIVIL